MQYARLSQHSYGRCVICLDLSYNSLSLPPFISLAVPQIFSAALSASTANIVDTPALSSTHLHRTLPLTHELLFQAARTLFLDLHLRRKCTKYLQN
jgi:hypothetical protein